ncbi:testis-specific serine/threonine-protein kinase 3-like [Diretmus argenteus]
MQRPPPPFLEHRGYRIGEILGRGSFGTVISAYSDKLKMQVAIKIINKKDIWWKFLYRERTIALELKHKNIVKCFEILTTPSKAGLKWLSDKSAFLLAVTSAKCVSELRALSVIAWFLRWNSDGSGVTLWPNGAFLPKAYIVMELCSDGDLMTYIVKNGRLTEDQSHCYFKQLAAAMKYLHNKGIVHRDLKCDNLLLDNLDLKVCDFGLSRKVKYSAKSHAVVLSTTNCGTKQYMAPEVIKKIPYDPKAADVWSMGVTLYEMLTGYLPFSSKDKRLLQRQMEHRIAYPITVSVSPEVKDLILCMLHPVAEERIQLHGILNHPWVLGVIR